MSDITTAPIKMTTMPYTPTKQTDKSAIKKRFDIYSSDTKAEISHICWMLRIPYGGWPYLPDTSGVSNAFYHIMLMILYNRAYLNAPTSFGVLPCVLPTEISRQVTKMVIGENGLYLKKTTAETGVDFIWVDFGTNIFMVWGENHRCVYNALSAIRWRINKYRKIVEVAKENALLASIENTENDNGAITPTNITQPSVVSVDCAGSINPPTVLVWTNHENGDDTFVHVPENNVNSECVLSPIWTKDDSSELEFVDGEVPIVINDHESDTVPDGMGGGDMNGIMSMIMNMLSANSSKS